MLAAPVAGGGKEKHHTRIVTTGSTGATRLSPRNGFNGVLRALLGVPGLLAPVPPGFDPGVISSVGETGPHDFAVRMLHAFVGHRLRPSHPVPRK
jgi:hypothetical protein